MTRANHAEVRGAIGMPPAGMPVCGIGCVATRAGGSVPLDVTSARVPVSLHALGAVLAFAAGSISALRKDPS